MDDFKDIPETGAVFTFGRSRFAENIPSHFFIKKDPIVDIACGDEHTLAVCQKGRVFSFGNNAWGELGLGTKTSISRPNCIKTLKPFKVEKVACGRAHSLFLIDDGRVFSCGSNDEGQLGLGHTLDELTPTEIGSLVNIIQISAGFRHSAALTGEGKVLVWGGNDEGQLGLGDVDQVATPTWLQMEKIDQIACGYYHTLLLTYCGLVFSFGEGDHGKLGQGDEVGLKEPKMIKMEEKMSFIAAGGNHSAAISRNGQLFVWGSNDFGQLGLEQDMYVPTILQTDYKIKYVSLGDNHSAFISEMSELYTMGNNHNQKLALDQNLDLSGPTKVKKFEPSKVIKVCCGGCHTMVQAVPKNRWHSQNMISESGDDSTCSGKVTLPRLYRNMPLKKLEIKPEEVKESEEKMESSQESVSVRDFNIKGVYNVIGQIFNAVRNLKSVVTNAEQFIKEFDKESEDSDQTSYETESTFTSFGTQTNFDPVFVINEKNSNKQKYENKNMLGKINYEDIGGTGDGPDISRQYFMEQISANEPKQHEENEEKQLSQERNEIKNESKMSRFLSKIKINASLPNISTGNIKPAQPKQHEKSKMCVIS